MNHGREIQKDDLSVSTSGKEETLGLVAYVALAVLQSGKQSDLHFDSALSALLKSHLGHVKELCDSLFGRLVLDPSDVGGTALGLVLSQKVFVVES